MNYTVIWEIDHELHCNLGKYQKDAFYYAAIMHKRLRPDNSELYIEKVICE